MARRHPFGLVLAAGLALAAAAGTARAGDAEWRLGAGATYWRMLEDVQLDAFDRDGVGYFLGLQYRPGLAGWGVDVERLPDGFLGAAGTVYAPQFYVVAGRGLFAAAGAGWYVADGEASADPFFNLRAGLDVELLPSVHLELFANYRFTDAGQLNDDRTDIDTDTVFLGAALRGAF